MTGVNGADLAPACDRAAVHLAGRDREPALTVAAAGSELSPQRLGLSKHILRKKPTP